MHRALIALPVAALLAGCTSEPSAAPSSPASSAVTSATPTPSPTASSPSATAKPGARVVRTLARGLDVPWGLALLPSGEVLVSTRDDGRIHRLDPDTGRIDAVGRVPRSVSNVDEFGEGGLLGLAVAPTYSSDGRVYAYYSTRADNRIAWSTDLRTWHPILTGIPHGLHHNGGRLAFGPDGMLYASTGEAGTPSLAPDPASLGGKILRMTPGGDPAPDNPDAGSVVWTLGHRNVQGLAFDGDGRLWASEFGSHAFDELNLIEAGQNYGWPETEGSTTDPRFTGPVAEWGTEEDSPSGIAIASGAVWMAALQGERLWRIPLRGARAGKPQDFLNGRYGRLRSVLALDDSTLLITTSNRDGRATPGKDDDRLLLVSVS